MNNLIKIFLFLSLIINSSFASNSQFKASFMKDNKETTFIGDKPENKTESAAISIKELEATFEEFNNTSDSLERIINKSENCLIDSNGFENCPSNAVQCNELIEKTNGNSKLISKTLLVNKYLKDGIWICPATYVDIDGNNSESGKCKKEYSFYEYSCDNSDKNDYNIGWKGPVVSTGNDCLGSCGENGCFCNEEKAPENNCIRENYGCPFDIEQKCTKMKDSVDTRTNLYKGEIYSLGSSKKINKELKDKKICSKGFIFENGECIKNANKTCPIGFEIKNDSCVKKITCNNKNGLCIEYPKNNICPTNYILENNLCVKPNLSLNQIIKINSDFYEKTTLEKSCPKNSIFNEELNLCVETGNCPVGYISKYDSCIKEYSYYQYSCPENYNIKDKGEDCLGFCGPNGCSCNSDTPKENNCSKSYDLINNDSLSFDYKRAIKKNNTSGDFNLKGFSKYYGFSYPENKIDNISKIYTIEDEPNKLCFKANNGDSSCITVNNCSFKGSIYQSVIKEINISDKKIYLDDKEKFIESSCDLNGHVGWQNRIEGITSIKSGSNKLYFYDSFKDKHLGFIEFVSTINQEDLNEGFVLKNTIPYNLQKEGFFASQYLEGFTYFVSEEEMSPFFCDKVLEKFPEAQKEYKFESDSVREMLKILSGDKYKYLGTDNLNKCIIKFKGNISFDSNEYTFKKEEMNKDFTIYKCSPISCNDNSCQKASCPEGYDGLIHTKNEFIADDECQLQSCDANKPYALYCGLSKECDITQPNILLKDGKCSKAICASGVFDKEKNKCIDKTCPEGFSLKNSICVKN